MYLFVVYILFAPVISTSIHRCVNNSYDIKVLMKVIKTETFNVGLHITIIIILSCRKLGYPWPSHATSRSTPLAGLQGYIPYPHCSWMYVRAGHPAFARPYVGVHRSTLLMSSSLLLQQCPVGLVRLTWIVFVMGGRWPYSWCLVECCRQDLVNIARSILV